MARLLALCLMAFLWVAVAAANPSAFASGDNGKPQPTLVCTGCLASNLELENLRILDARTSVGAYIKSHIPGAVYLNIESLRLSSGGIPGQLLPPDRLAYVFSELGIGNDTPVIVYSSTEDHLANSTYVALALASAGHELFAVLDGGFEQWEKESLPLTADVRPVAKARFRPGRGDVIVTRATVEALIQKRGGITLVDARPAPAFAAGHIPGAISVPAAAFGAMPESPLWLKPEQIEGILSQTDLRTPSPVVIYCGSGRDASKAWFTLRYLMKFPSVKVYDGSMAEWDSLGLPKETAATTEPCSAAP
ncbi:MAG: rhodanese-like domain-containing protein [Candidatus Sumerlaeaceae bacterium]|nr:rhodanese-like domain-containing protein [Candidatus Sumerlaeaceae bacterium]